MIIRVRRSLDYLEYIRDIIACCCFAVQGVEGDRHRSPWAYTVGLTAHGKPQVLVTGLSFARSARLLDDVASHVLHAEARRLEKWFWRGGPVIEIVEVPVPTVHLAIAVEIFGPEIRALQLVHADDRSTGHGRLGTAVAAAVSRSWECARRVSFPGVGCSREASTGSAGFTADSLDDLHRLILGDRIELVLRVSSFGGIQHARWASSRGRPKRFVLLAALRA